MAYTRVTGSGVHYKGKILLKEDGTHSWELSERASTDEITGSKLGSGATIITHTILGEGDTTTYDQAAAALKTAWDTYK
tara:strand:- start:1668 stop:1904 length:237 start_codon:yes stop_codon:yes gene_type:complete